MSCKSSENDDHHHHHDSHSDEDEEGKDGKPKLKRCNLFFEIIPLTLDEIVQKIEKE